MSSTVAHNPCVFRETDFFQIKLCSCGVTHLYFGPTTLNLSSESVRMLSHVLNEVVRTQDALSQADPVNSSEAALDGEGNIIKGYFPSQPTH